MGIFGWTQRGHAQLPALNATRDRIISFPSLQSLGTATGVAQQRTGGGGVRPQISYKGKSRYERSYLTILHLLNHPHPPRLNERQVKKDEPPLHGKRRLPPYLHRRTREGGG